MANRPVSGRVALWQGAEYGNKKWVVWAIEEMYTSPVEHYGESALVIASRYGHLQIVKYLLELPLDKYNSGAGGGAPDEYVSDDAHHALEIAVNYRHYPVVEYLMNLPTNVPVHSANIVDPAQGHNELMFSTLADFRVDMRMAEIFLRDRRVMEQLQEDVIDATRPYASDPFHTVCLNRGVRGGATIGTLERRYNEFRTARARKALAISDVVDRMGAGVMPDAASDVLHGFLGLKCTDCGGLRAGVVAKRAAGG